jgi:hypothetical protein
MSSEYSFPFGDCGPVLLTQLELIPLCLLADGVIWDFDQGAYAQRC